jgi:hypothetical protein
VFRLRLGLFQAAYRFRIEDISQQEFLQTSWEGNASFSPEETEAFRAWAQGRIDHAKATFPKDPNLRLRYTGQTR